MRALCVLHVLALVRLRCINEDFFRSTLLVPWKAVQGPSHLGQCPELDPQCPRSRSGKQATATRARTGTVAIAKAVAKTKTSTMATRARAARQRQQALVWNSCGVSAVGSQLQYAITQDTVWLAKEHIPHASGASATTSYTLGPPGAAPSGTSPTTTTTFSMKADLVQMT